MGFESQVTCQLGAADRANASCETRLRRSSGYGFQYISLKRPSS
jgi:hypothetical protein